MATLALTLPAESLLRSRLRAGKRPSTLGLYEHDPSPTPYSAEHRSEDRRIDCARTPASGYAQWRM